MPLNINDITPNERGEVWVGGQLVGVVPPVGREDLARSMMMQQDGGLASSNPNAGYSPGQGSQSFGSMLGLSEMGNSNSSFMGGAPPGGSMFGGGRESSLNDPSLTGQGFTTANASMTNNDFNSAHSPGNAATNAAVTSPSAPGWSGGFTAAGIPSNGDFTGSTFNSPFASYDNTMTPAFSGINPLAGLPATRGFPDTVSDRYAPLPGGVPPAPPSDFPNGVPVPTARPNDFPNTPRITVTPLPTAPPPSTPGIPGESGVSTSASPGSSGFGGGIDMSATGGYEGSSSVGNTTGAAGFTSPGGGSGYGNVGGSQGSYGSYAGSATAPGAFGGMGAPGGFSMTGGYDPGSFSAGFAAGAASVGGGEGVGGGGMGGGAGAGAGGQGGGADPGGSPGGVG